MHLTNFMKVAYENGILPLFNARVKLEVSGNDTRQIYGPLKLTLRPKIEYFPTI